MKMLEQTGVTHVLCIASPTIYQHIQKNSRNIESLMLDLDVRFVSGFTDMFIECWFHFLKFVYSANSTHKNSIYCTTCSIIISLMEILVFKYITDFLKDLKISWL